jgi:DNA polymerase/3'-5' exonuclease PolX
MANEEIIKYLNLLLAQKKKEKDTFRIRAIGNAITAIKGINYEITNGNQLKDIPGIGKGIMDRIDEILETGKLKQLGDTSEFDTLQLFEKIYGVGAVKAQELYNQGYRTIEELRKNEDNLNFTSAQKVGLKHFEDINSKIPRSEITKFKKILTKAVKAVSPEIEFEIVGSYRRKAKESGDIDVLFTHPKDVQYLEKILEEMEKTKILTDTLSKGKYKYLGMGKIDEKYRRIDFLYIPYDEYYTALVYFTGSGKFNTEMRQKAKDMGMRLNEHALLKNKKIIPINSEKELFDILGMEYLKPENRK